MIPVVLAHGALGVFDELIFVVVGVVFVALMIGAWVAARRRKASTPPATQEPEAKARPDHFPLA